VEPLDVSLQLVTEHGRDVLSNLLELYVHDMSEFFPHVQIGESGRFGYEQLPHYWAEPERHFAFLIRSGPKLAGFALATRGSPASEDPNTLDVAEFFVLRSLRRQRVGRDAAHALWRQLPGRWTVRVSEANAAALPFWTKAIHLHTGVPASATLCPGKRAPWHVFSFDSSARTAGH
jgi:predicted acetyltransferase